MSTKCPIILPTLVIADDARLAAQVSCLFANPGAYLPVLDGPRRDSPEFDAEIIRSNHAAARAKPSLILLAGLPDDSCDAIANHFAPRLKPKLKRIAKLSDVDSRYRDGPPLKRPPLLWGRDRIGVGLLKALRARSGIVFSDNPSPAENVPSTSDHLVVCEDGDELSQVIAANYAFALGAGLYVIPGFNEPTSEQMLEDLYDLCDQQQTPPIEALKNLKALLRRRCGALQIPPSGSATFVTRRLPYGFAFPEYPSTHLLSCHGIGAAVINGFAAEQPNAPGMSVAVLVDPGTAMTPEIAAAKTLLPSSSMLLRSYEGSVANARAVTEMIELFPYDLLIISTHCGDAPGYRWTYEFTDSEGIARNLVVDGVVGVARSDQAYVLSVTRFTHFVSLDGMDLHDPKTADKIHVGCAVLDFLARTQAGCRNALKPVKTETISRVVGSAALIMYDHNYLSLPRPVADHGTPVIINNARCSWQPLADNFTFGGARATIATLFPVTTGEAQEVVVKLLGMHFGAPLPAALWSAQREVQGVDVRRPYVMTGVYPQRLRASSHDVPKYIASRLAGALRHWKAALKALDSSDEQTLKTHKDVIQFYEHELTAIKKRWLRPGPGVAERR